MNYVCLSVCMYVCAWSIFIMIIICCFPLFPVYGINYE